MTVQREYQSGNTMRRRFTSGKKVCGVDTLKKRMPIIEWLPKYSMAFFIQDILAGITVGLTAIPQGIAYAIVAGLAPEYGLYASLTSGVVYMIFGSCKAVTVGPTAILASMVAKYVSNYSADFAILAAFLSGVVQLAMGIFNLGFLVEFISMPVISAFTTAAALQIAAAQLKAFFGLQGSSGNTFGESAYNFVLNIKTAKLWDPILAASTIVMLILLQKLGQGCKRTDGIFKQMRWFISLARNAVVVVFGMILAYILKIIIEREPLELIGEIGSGLPTIGPPPFSTTVGNTTYTFTEMLQVLGPQSIVLPLVGVLESVAIGKAFSEGGRIDATQELIAIGLCNLIGSFAKSMPITGSFTRTALNYASGVQTQAGGVTKVLILIAALSLFASTFYYIPKASLAGLIIMAMYSMIDFAIIKRLWIDSKREFFLYAITGLVCLFFGLEYGIVTGILIEALVLLYSVARPKLEVSKLKSDSDDVLVITLNDNIAYCAAEHIRRVILKTSSTYNSVIVLDGTNIKRMDVTVAENLMLVVKDFEKTGRKILLVNFDPILEKVCLNNDLSLAKYFFNVPSLLDLPGKIAKDV